MSARTKQLLFSTRTCMARKDRQPWLASAKRKTDAAMALMMAVGRVQASDADPQPDAD